MTSQTDKRKAERRGCWVPIEGKRGTAFETSQTVDISKGGLGLILGQSVMVGEKIGIEIELDPLKDPILVMGQVKWVRPVAGADSYRVGISFFDVLMAKAENRLAKHLSK